MARGPFSASNYFSRTGISGLGTFPITYGGFLWLTTTAAGSWSIFSDGNSPSQTSTLRLHKKYDEKIYNSWKDGSSNQADPLSSTAISASAWTHIAGTINSAGNSTRVWINGIERASSSTSAVSWTPQSQRALGCQVGGATPAAEAHLAEFAVWNSELTAAELLSLTAGYSPLLVRPGSLTAYYPLRERTGDALDYVGGVHITQAGTVPAVAHPRIIYPAPVFYSFPAAGGSTFNKTVSESLSLADTASETADFSVTAGETLNLADVSSELATFVETLAETLNLADTATGTTAISVAIAESLNLSDTASETAAFAASVAESLSLLDTATRTAIINRALAETLSLSDTVTGTTGIAVEVSETLSLSDTTSEIATFLRAVSETLSLTDTAAKASWTGTRSVSETLSLSDTATAEGGAAVVTRGRGGLSLSEKRMRELERIQMLQRDDDEIIALLTRFFR